MSRPLIIPFFIPHAGCPHGCVFCNQRLITGTGRMNSSRGHISAQIAAWLGRSPGRPAEVAFYGGSFTLLPQDMQASLLEAVQPFIRQRLVEGIRISTRPDAVSDTALSFLKEYRVRTVEIGVQSLDDRVLQASGRGHTASDSLQAIQKVRGGGFTVGAQLLPGLPEDSESGSLQTMRGVIAAGAQFVRLYPAVVLQGTLLAAAYLSGRYCPPDLSQGVRTAARMLDLAVKAGVPVVRIGLQAEEGLQAPAAILAGCWHPALGHLVRSRLVLDLVMRMVRQLPLQRELRLVCHPRFRSEVVGQRCSNLLQWRRAGVDIAQIHDDPLLEFGQIRLEGHQGCITGSPVTDQIYEENVNA